MKKTVYSMPRPVYLLAASSVVGKKEKAGPLGTTFDLSGDDRFGQKSWERAEAEMQRMALDLAVKKGGWAEQDIDLLFAGDLINQCIVSSYGLCSYHTPYLGIFGACSTVAEGLFLSAVHASSVCSRCAAVTSSHYCTAERQFRFPLEYGCQRTPTAQWTVTGAGAFLITSVVQDLQRSAAEYAVVLSDGIPGRIVDRGITDAANMGAAMAPAAADTLLRYFQDGYHPDNFDLIVTGDLGREGSAIFNDFMKAAGFPILSIHKDCGLLIFDTNASDTHVGGSGCGCSAVVLASELYSKLSQGILRNMLFIATGALMNSMALQQKQTIPGIAHLVHLQSIRKADIVG